MSNTLKAHPAAALYSKYLLGVDLNKILDDINYHQAGDWHVVTEIQIPLPAIALFGIPVKFVENKGDSNAVHYKIIPNPQPPKCS